MTLPVGVPPPGAAVTVAVKVTAWPVTDGLADEASVVVVVAWMACVKGDEVLLAKAASPLYMAVMLWAPIVRVVVLSVARPSLPRGAVPSGALPSRNVTVPVGVPRLG